LLDFVDRWSVSVVGTREGKTDRPTKEPVIKIMLPEILGKLDEAARAAKLAAACAESGAVSEGKTVSMEFEQLLYEAGRLQDAASLLNRLSRE
jgi:hypothetical protein